MQTNTILGLLKNGILYPEKLWQEEVSENISWAQYIKFPVLPIIVLVGVVSGILTKVFGYHIPVIGVIHPSMSDVVIQAIGTIVIYLIFLILMGWVAAYLAGLFDGKNDWNKSVQMLFLTSIPSLFGQLLSPLPYIGWVIALGLGVYTMVLLYKAIPVFLGVPLESRAKHFILFLIASFVISMAVNISIGSIFAPKNLMQGTITDIKTMTHTNDEVVHQNQQQKTHNNEDYVQDYVDAMAKGDYNKDVIKDTADDTFIAPPNNRLTRKQVEQFINLAKKVKIVEKEQAKKLKEKYDKKEKSDDFSLTDIFNGLKDVSNMATLEMKVVKTNGGNWAEYQWVKDRIREAYYTPSLNQTTQENAKLLKGHDEVISSIL